MTAARAAAGIAGLVAIVGAVGCSTPTGPGTPLTVTHVSAPGFISFPTQGFPAPVAAGNRLIRDADTWLALWTTKNVIVPPPSAPTVDFSKYVVAFTAMGTEPTSGYTAKIIDLTVRSDGWLVVDVEERSPCGGLDVITQPADAVLVPRPNAFRVTFNVTATKIGC